MKAACLACIYCGVTIWCYAQSVHTLTNDVVINERGVHLIIVGEGSCSNVFANDNILRTDQDNVWMLHNPSSNRVTALLPHGPMFAFELRTTNGSLLPKTELGEKWSERPRSVSDPSTGRGISILPGEDKAGVLPNLTDLINFPSNGVYTLEIRCWAWSYSKKQFILSDPVRVRVIKK